MSWKKSLHDLNITNRTKMICPALFGKSFRTKTRLVVQMKAACSKGLGVEKNGLLFNCVNKFINNL